MVETIRRIRKEINLLLGRPRNWIDYRDREVEALERELADLRERLREAERRAHKFECEVADWMDACAEYHRQRDAAVEAGEQLARQVRSMLDNRSQWYEGAADGVTVFEVHEKDVHDALRTWEQAAGKGERDG